MRFILKIELSMGMGRKIICVTLNVACLLAPDGQVCFFHKLLIYWDFPHTTIAALHKRPPQTPGLSLIEHFWEVVKQHIQFMDWQGKNLQQLQNAKIIPIPINVFGILWNLCSASEQCSNKEHLMETLVYVYIAHQSQLQVKI